MLPLYFIGGVFGQWMDKVATVNVDVECHCAQNKLWKVHIHSVFTACSAVCFCRVDCHKSSG